MRGICKKCKVEHVTPLGYPSCSAHAKRTGTACKANPVRGATVCSKHGGQVGAVKRNAAVRVAEQQVERTLAQMVAGHYRPDEHPFTTLVELGRRLAARERALDELAGEYRAVGHEDNLQAALRLANDTARLSAQVSKTVLDANIDERMAKINEGMREHIAAHVTRALRVAMHRAELLPSQMDVVRKTLGEELRHMEQV
jgi:hypothetical protein